MMFVGDVMLDDTPGKVLAQGRDPFKHVRQHLLAADFRIGNLECVVATRGKAEPDKPYAFRVPPKVLATVGKHLDAVALANNHSGDFGPVAFAQMLGLLEQYRIPYFGGGRDLKAAHQPLIVERKGLTIALLSYNDFFPRSFEALPGQPGTAWAEDDQIAFDLKHARALGADLVIPFMHWGWENETVSNQDQKRLARFMIDRGADAVVGGHPHVVQDLEVYKGKPIVYSLGNFVFDGFSDAINNTGWMLSLQVDKSGVKQARVTEVNIDREGLPKPVSSMAPCWAQGQQAWSKCHSPAKP